MYVPRLQPAERAARRSLFIMLCSKSAAIDST